MVKMHISEFSKKVTPWILDEDVDAQDEAVAELLRRVRTGEIILTL